MLGSLNPKLAMTTLLVGQMSEYASIVLRFCGCAV